MRIFPTDIYFKTNKIIFLSSKATDDYGHGQTTSVSLRIGLADANDNAPSFFNKENRVVVDEGSEKFDPPLRIEAHDRDKTSKITYSLVDPHNTGVFKIDPDTGEITLAKKVTLDITNSSSDKITVSVHANDGKFTNEAVVRITVRDVNNNAPVFPHELYSTSIPELSKIGKFI